MTLVSEASDKIMNNIKSDLLTAVIFLCFVFIFGIVTLNVFFPPVDENNKKWVYFGSALLIVVLIAVTVFCILLKCGYIQF